MIFCNIKDDYIDFLRQYDNKVAANKKENRPYVGVVLEIAGIKYYAPFTSPKLKHQKMHNSKDFRKIGGGKYGVINFNNMIPVPDEAIILININNEPNQQYRRLLQNQYHFVTKDTSSILKTAKELRTLVFKDDNELTAHDKIIKARCCNLPLLESIYIDYNRK